jgi:divalent metal cation (Fe/Co/Zn/Cd) transporter
VDFPESLTRSAYRVSLASVVFSGIASSVAIALGIGNAIVLVAFGAIGYVDAVGSVALTYHFRHALRHEGISERFERVAHRVVRIGLAAVGLATIGVSVVRLVSGRTGSSPIGGSALAAVSLVVLALLSARKRRLGRALGSKALLADGRVSAVGAIQAAIVLVGLALTARYDATWADPVAAMVVAVGAVVVAIVDPD